MDVRAVRADFPILQTTISGKPLVYLDNAATTHKPRAVLDRVHAFYAGSNSNVHRGVHQLSEAATETYEAARETVRRFIGARSAREITFNHGTTDAVNILADCLELEQVGPGDEIIVTEMEHHSNLVPWQLVCQRRGARLVVLRFADDGMLRLDLLENLLTERTRLVAVSHVSNVLGRINPVKEVVARAHARNVPVFVDAAQSVPHLALDVQDLDCDFLAFSGHKMYAGTGIGVLYGKEAWLERLPPRRYGGGMVESVDLEASRFGDLPFRFEAGTPNVAGAVSLAAAVDYLAALGMADVRAHEQTVMHYAMERLAALSGISMYGRGPDKCGAISFNLEGVDAYDVALVLDKLGIAIRSGTHCAAPVMQHYGVAHCLRASFALYNTTEEIDALIDGLQRARAVLS